ncbi:phosphoglycolate phosphatase [Cerasibacillus sp. JNUCC 74]
MKKNTMVALILICSSLSLIFIAWIFVIGDHGSPDEFNAENWPKTKEKAIQTTVDYFKKEKNLEVTVDEVSSSGEYASHEIYLKGHVTNNKQEKFSVTLDSSKNFKVVSIN